jgi:hypothetical protein
VLCCKLHHDNDKRCIFRCQYGAHPAPAAQPALSAQRELRHG